MAHNPYNNLRGGHQRNDCFIKNLIVLTGSDRERFVCYEKISCACSSKLLLYLENVHSDGNLASGCKL